jgi:pantothenate kinase type III
MNRLVLDIGNTKTAVGVFRDGHLETQWRITTSHWTSDDLWVILKALLGDVGEPLDAAVSSRRSVIPCRDSAGGTSPSSRLRWAPRPPG